MFSKRLFFPLFGACLLAPQIAAQPQRSSPLYDHATQWYLDEPLSGINIGPAWQITQGSPRVIVAVIDSGILFDHPLLKGRILPGYDMVSQDPMPCPPDRVAHQYGCPFIYAGDGDGRDSDASDPGDAYSVALLRAYGEPETKASDSSWHGTSVASIIAAQGHASWGLSGISRHSRILPVRAGGRGYNRQDLVDSIRWAAGLPVAGVPHNRFPAQVLNISLSAEDEDVGRVCPADIQQAIDEALQRGSARAIVASAGNDGKLDGARAPANCRGVITVTAVTRNGHLADYADYGRAITLAAPASALDDQDGGYSDYPVASHCALQHPVSDARHCPDPAAPGAPWVMTPGAGTSYSAPIVSGTIALMLAANPSLTSGGIRQILQRTARPYAPSSFCYHRTDLCGSGVLDAGHAVLQAALLPGGVREASGQRPGIPGRR
ncbi:hypothetical protein THUN1379_09410 [Paludibacterium sp. THUN1379]|uniref:S8 family serine peptidase n=1 Tax=Paludibacterium sp. THUN1379 TaxID=3112107 RepID=UPI003086AE3C|nr:hypothetical protein THUN1379_09410 [Paludibacterium sp. THUN1379]